MKDIIASIATSRGQPANGVRFRWNADSKRPFELGQRSSHSVFGLGGMPRGEVGALYASGGNDKGEILKRLNESGYKSILFVADSSKDLEYANFPRVNFYRIQSDDDYKELLNTLPKFPPDQKEPWGFTERELDFFASKPLALLERYLSEGNPGVEFISDFINT